VWFQNFFYFSGLTVLLGLPIFQQSVGGKLYEWLLKEQRRRKARSVQEVQTKLRQMFKHRKQKWPNVPFDTQAALDNIKRAIEISAEYSKHSGIIWHQQTAP